MTMSSGLPTFRRSIMFRCQGCRCRRTNLIVCTNDSSFLFITDVSFESQRTDYSVTFQEDRILIHTAATPQNSHVLIFFRDQRAPQLSMSLPCKTGHNGESVGVWERCLAVVWTCRLEDSVSLLTSQRGACSVLITALSRPAQVRGDG